MRLYIMNFTAKRALHNDSSRIHYGMGVGRPPSLRRMHPRLTIDNHRHATVSGTQLCPPTTVHASWYKKTTIYDVRLARKYPTNTEDSQGQTESIDLTATCSSTDHTSSAPRRAYLCNALDPDSICPRASFH